MARRVTDGERLPVGRLSNEQVAAVPSATTVLLREAESGFEVFMLERHVETEFAGGAYVFPGGRVEEADRSLDLDRWSGLDLASVVTTMQIDEGLALGLHVAAVRETFEESGFLLASRDGSPVTSADLTSESFQAAREKLASRDESWDWAGWLEAERLVLDLGALAWWSWWVTPREVHKRFETWFFVSAVPEDQAGAHDEIETVASRWTSPDAALRAGRTGEVTIVYPTRKNLEGLAGYGSAAAVLEAARSGEVDRRRVLPEVVQQEDGGIRVRHPFTGEMEAP
jgi:8-oxo-dGTP pyrophosphatase MutT (NUDIX family)